MVLITSFLFIFHIINVPDIVLFFCKNKDIEILQILYETNGGNYGTYHI